MSTMRAVQVVGHAEHLQLTEAPVPEVTGPFDVVVRIRGAGVCRTDLHVLEGQWAETSQVALPCTIGYENAATSALEDVQCALDDPGRGDGARPGDPRPLTRC